jgi:acyl phosphate:glycerol-3-phosphate acyltransferase
MITIAVISLGSYLLGSIPFGYLAGRFAGVDIRKFGSGNVGATNVGRVLGRRYGYPVFALDFLKGFGAVRISMLVATGQPPEWNSPEIIGIAAAISCIIGHSYPAWLKFKGGKGVATSAGTLFALTPIGGAIGVAIWIGMFCVTRYVSVASVTVAAVLPLVILTMSWQNENAKEIFYFSVCVAAIVIWRHRSNLSRLMRGTELRFNRK